MLAEKLYRDYITILESELKPALGCTEPIAIAFAAAKAREVLGRMPEKMEVQSSGNIIKNVMGVYVPKSDGMKGIDAAAILGMLAGHSEENLEVLNGVTQAEIVRTKELLKSGMCKCTLKEGVANLYIRVIVEAEGDTAAVELQDHHTNITEITRNGEVVFRKENEQSGDNLDQLKKELTLADIMEFARTVRIDDVREVLSRQIRFNSAISDEGLKKKYGAGIGRMVMQRGQKDIRLQAAAKAAAGSDARMNGCPMPVIINSGSGNQGITATLPVLVYAKHLNKDEDALFRALVISNLVSIYQKTFIGSLSAFCGAVCAAAGSGAAVTYLLGGTDEQIGNTVANTLATIGGMVCDGAKSSCASKIAMAVETALLGAEMSMTNNSFAAGDGLVKSSAEETIESYGRMGREGMKSTDIEILNIMLGR